MTKQVHDHCTCSETITVGKKQHLMQQIAECEFMLIDINLFLDIHPDDTRALDDYNCYAEQLAALKDLYVKNYGPIHNFGNSVSKGSWRWVKADWPWHNDHMSEPMSKEDTHHVDL